MAQALALAVVGLASSSTLGAPSHPVHGGGVAVRHRQQQRQGVVDLQARVPSWDHHSHLLLAEVVVGLGTPAVGVALVAVPWEPHYSKHKANKVQQNTHTSGQSSDLAHTHTRETESLNRSHLQVEPRTTTREVRM